MNDSVNHKYYLGVLTKLWEWVRKKRIDLWKNNSWILHEDNAPAHNTLKVKQHLIDKCILVLEHPPPLLFIWFSPLWLLPVPQNEKCIKRNSFSVCRWGEIKNGRPAKKGVSWWPAALLSAVKNLYAAVYRWGGYVERDSNWFVNILKIHPIFYISPIIL